MIKVYNHEFEILDCDEYTQKVLDNPNSNHRKFDLVAVLGKLRESMRQQFPLVRDIFRRFDHDHQGVVTIDVFKTALKKFGFQLSHEEVATLMQHFDSRGAGQISYNEFCDVLLDEDYTTSMLKTKPPLREDLCPAYAEKAVMKRQERLETEAVRKAVREIGDVLYKRVGFQQRLFREFSHITHLSVVTTEQIQYGLHQLGHSFDLADVERCVRFIMPEGDFTAVNYVDFFKALQSAYHDLNANR